MRILLIGSGGREHALAWKMVQSPLCDALFIAPGNPGTAACGTNLPIAVTDFDGIEAACLQHGIGMVVVGPEEPLVLGLTDRLRGSPALPGIAVIGPDRAAAQLEGSKAFAKEFMFRHGIPTAGYREFNNARYEEGVAYLRSHALPIVLKADGLAAGKGVVICETHQEAIDVFASMVRDAKFGDAGKNVVVEQFLDGIEMSVFVLTDGTDFVLLPEAKDYKRIGTGDTGPNTGGMGAVSPVPFADAALMKRIEDSIIRPTVNGLHADGLHYRGFVFFGLMIVGGQPYVIEYNCRMGDPETEVVIPRLHTDLIPLLCATASGQLKGASVASDPRTACTVVAVSGGYPGSYAKDVPISGIRSLPEEESILFHMGTAENNGQLVTAGGRVCCVTSFGASVNEAVQRSKDVIRQISFAGMYYRSDIGYEFD